MNIRIVKKNDVNIAVFGGEAEILTVADALDAIADCSYNHDCYALAIHAHTLSPDFFQLRTGLAGEMLQKFVNYGARLCVIVDYDAYDSKAWRDFVRESNKGRQVNFKKTEEEAIEALSKE